MKINGAGILIKMLEKYGIDKVAGVPGGANLPIYDALYDSKIKHILVRQEQSAGFIAQGIARTTGKTAVCIATSGPGATNLLTAIADAKLDSIPIIAITGQVSTNLIGTDAFQEVDTYGMTIPITKHNFLVKSAKELLEVIPEAFKIANSGRPGPVAIDIPKDVQLEEIELDKLPDFEKKIEIEDSDKQLKELDYEAIAKIINNSEKPLLYIGGGVISSDSSDLILEFAEKNNIPVTTTLMGLGAFPAKNKLFLGMLGMHGFKHTNSILNKTDLLLAFGVRFDDRATGNIKKFCENAKIIHVDIDNSELHKNKYCDMAYKTNINLFLKNILTFIENKKRKEWLSEIESLKKIYPLPKFDKNNFFDPINFIKKISSMSKENFLICTDVGQHQMWTAQYFEFNKPKTFLTSSGLGTMGFGLPTAIGASLENPEKTVLCISGDGSFLMNIQELATLKEMNLNVKILLMNNNSLGLVRQQQELFYKNRTIASEFECKPNFKAIADGFGIESYDLKDENEPEKLVENLLTRKGSIFINIPVDSKENVFPIVKPGFSNFEMIEKGGLK